MRTTCCALAQGATSGVVDDAAALVSVRGLFFMDRTKAILCSYLAGLIKGAIPPYYSYYRENPSLVTVQQVVAFLYKAVTDKDWMKIQQTMDLLERLALEREVPQYLLWISLARPAELNAVKAELHAYFELDQGRSTARDLAGLFGVDLSSVKRVLVYGAVAYATVLFLPVILPAVSSVTSAAGSSLSQSPKRRA